MVESSISLPDTLVVGPMRTGTSWIHKYLEKRNDVCLPRGVKETRFFDKHYKKGVEWYKSHFTKCGDDKIVEVAPSYFHNRKAPKRIRKTIGRVNIIVIVRNPIDRSISHYYHLRRYGFVDCDLKDAIRQFPEIVRASKYYERCVEWMKIVGTSRISFLRLRTLKNDPKFFADRLCQSLYISNRIPPDDMMSKKVNSATNPPSAYLARVGQKVADVFRAWRLYRPINFAKKLGFKRLFFGSSKSRAENTIDNKGINLLRKLLEEDWNKFKEHVYVENPNSEK